MKLSTLIGAICLLTGVASAQIAFTNFGRPCGGNLTGTAQASRAGTMIHMDVTNAAAWVGVAPKTLEHWYYDYLQRQQQRPAGDLAPIRSLGIDELSLKKGTASSASC